MTSQGGTPGRERSGSLTSAEQRQAVKKVFEPIALFFGRLGLTPNGLTLLGFGITIVAALLAGFQLWLVAGIVVMVGGVFDMFDGTLARATGKVGPLGAFFDSTFDRWGEAITWVGVAVGCMAAGNDLGATLSILALSSAFMVSYARARAEGLGFSPGSGLASVGLAPREIRLVVLTVALILTGILGGVAPWDPADPTAGLTTAGNAPFLLGVGAIFVLATITVVQRVASVRAQASAAKR
ncbi:MAG: CDP-alcohol phosphatidyltransferase family protein [Chloroflexi bacterium]|jgi:phosphatidylglycerophosphate synthase|nr:CDP-alcohol phosphatidyltransferase family protein [Chloroflexota bacterium]